MESPRRTRNESCFGNLRLVRQDGASRDKLSSSDLQFLKEFKNKDLRTAREINVIEIILNSSAP